ncbi:Kef-type K+ transport system membrane component KefB [Bacilli bacterium PM5-9]|nr:Kef-type K+ transport system membrane component KefB [Bacilli bacterium PM5-9]
METFFLILALILVSTKTLGILCSKIGLPAVLGYIVAGIILGPMVLNIAHSGDEIKFLSRLGIIFLMFYAGLDTDLDEFKKTALPSTLVGVAGVVAPLILGYFVAGLFFNDFWVKLFIGVILTATSVSITVETLSEMGKLKGKVGNIILGAAIIDDIIGLIVVSVVVSLVASHQGGTATSSIVEVIANIGIFGLIALVILFFVPRLITTSGLDFSRKGATPLVLAFALLMAFTSEYFGVAEITGAFLAGLTLSSIKNKYKIKSNIKTISTNFLSLIFFANIGLEATIHGLTPKIALMILALAIIAILSKLIGCGLMSKLFGLSNRESLQIGSGMVSRGEVAIIVANIGLEQNIIDQDIFVIMLAVIIVTTLVAPILLKFSFDKKQKQ